MKAKEETVRGRPVSGRAWKTVQTKRFSHQKDKSLRPGWEKQQLLRKERLVIKAIEAELKADKNAEKEAQKQLRKDRMKCKEEMERRAEVLQVVSATKIKHMSKKKLRGLRKLSHAELAARKLPSSS
ncbi:hypothetical protein SeMB42_g00125 [Synchytrium endobioticum]|uniref:rRNA-processing protein n=1 Tax=Synchytrium endobioticum TaxID=286115 RepID=A0A507DJA5_9FUNG|nr:hypothetical protein SeLEV6574_g00219 [Synchytrium endobioticum]TPX54903.1 hypothetical protein SeMB42_g00125 [Synchytrium endobioticum]